MHTIKNICFKQTIVKHAFQILGIRLECSTMVQAMKYKWIKANQWNVVVLLEISQWWGKICNHLFRHERDCSCTLKRLTSIKNQTACRKCKYLEDKKFEQGSNIYLRSRWSQWIWKMQSKRKSLHGHFTKIIGRTTVSARKD